MMELQNDYKSFKRFLKEKNAYIAFRSEILKCRHYERKFQTLEDFLKTTPANELIMYGINWSISKKGAQYWNNLYIEFKQIVNTYD